MWNGEDFSRNGKHWVEGVQLLRRARKAGDKEAAEAAFKAAQPHMDRAARKGLQHPNAMARAKSRLSAAIKSLSSE